MVSIFFVGHIACYSITSIVSNSGNTMLSPNITVSSSMVNYIVLRRITLIITIISQTSGTESQIVNATSLLGLSRAGVSMVSTRTLNAVFNCSLGTDRRRRGALKFSGQEVYTIPKAPNRAAYSNLEESFTWSSNYGRLLGRRLGPRDE